MNLAGHMIPPEPEGFARLRAIEMAARELHAFMHSKIGRGRPLLLRGDASAFTELVKRLNGLSLALRNA